MSSVWPNRSALGGSADGERAGDRAKTAASRSSRANQLRRAAPARRRRIAVVIDPVARDLGPTRIHACVRVVAVGLGVRALRGRRVAILVGVEVLAVAGRRLVPLAVMAAGSGDVPSTAPPAPGAGASRLDSPDRRALRHALQPAGVARRAEQRSSEWGRSAAVYAQGATSRPHPFAASLSASSTGCTSAPGPMTIR